MRPPRSSLARSNDTGRERCPCRPLAHSCSPRASNSTVQRAHCSHCPLPIARFPSPSLSPTIARPGLQLSPRLAPLAPRAESPSVPATTAVLNAPLLPVPPPCAAHTIASCCPSRRLRSLPPRMPIDPPAAHAHPLRRIRRMPSSFTLRPHTGPARRTAPHRTGRLDRPSSRLPPSRPLSLRRLPTYADEQRTTWPPGLAPAARAPRTCPTALSPTAPIVAPHPLPRQSPLPRTRP